MGFVRIGNDIIRVTNIIGFTVADGADQEHQIVVYLQIPLGNRSTYHADWRRDREGV